MHIFLLFLVFHPLSKKRKKLKGKKRKFISGTLADWARHTKASFIAVEWESCILFQMYLDPPIFRPHSTTLSTPPDTTTSTAAPLRTHIAHSHPSQTRTKTPDPLFISSCLLHSHWQGGLVEGQGRGGRLAHLTRLPFTLCHQSVEVASLSF